MARTWTAMTMASGASDRPSTTGLTSVTQGSRRLAFACGELPRDPGVQGRRQKGPHGVRASVRQGICRRAQKSQRANSDTGTDTRLPVSLIDPRPRPPIALSSPSRSST